MEKKGYFIMTDATTFTTLTTFDGNREELVEAMSGLLVPANMGQVTSNQLTDMLVNRQSEILGLLFCDGKLIGTAQASRLRTAGAPLVAINNLVVAKPFRRHGHARTVLQELLVVVANEWSKYGSLTIQATSKVTRGTKQLFLDTGFTLVETNVYRLTVR